MPEKIFEKFEYSNEYIKSQIIKLVGGDRIIDLLLFSPFDYTNFSITEELSAKEESKEVIVEVLILRHEPSFKISKKSPYKIFSELKDGTSLVLSFFAGSANLWKVMFKEGVRYKIACKLQKFNDTFYTVHPKIVSKYNFANANESSVLEPRYHLTGCVTQNIMQQIIKKHLKYAYTIKDFKLGELISLESAILAVHSPKNLHDAEEGRKRLAFDELLAKNIAFLFANVNLQKEKSIQIPFNQYFLTNALKALPFKLTDDQNAALSQIIKLQAESTQNNVLLQGDVGSGKTVLAILAAINASLSGFQVAVMSPTFILASQTFKAFSEIARKFEVEVLFFSGEDKGKKRSKKLDLIKKGDAKIIVGTHALFSSDVEFFSLAYAIIDEQHRFGIGQRLALTAKSSGVKTLLMTATPIPRTLSMALFGEIEVSYVKQKPKNRKEIITKLFSSKKIPEIMESIKRKIELGEQIYWVVPFIERAEEENERRGVSIEERKETLMEYFKKEEIVIIHGRMKESEISSAMEAFKLGKVKIMLATTVIEVGVNVPNATLIIIESAENFGLSTLHQLRGRVGRGALQSYCFLITTARNEFSVNKLKILTESNDGFFIAEKDMEIRGSGAILSKMQSGFECFKFVKLDTDLSLISLAKKEANKIFKNDHNLESDLGLKIRSLLKFYNYDFLINYYKI